MIELSVVIPTFNRAESLCRTLQSLNRCEYHEPFEVVVVDDGSEDETPALLDKIDVDFHLVVVRQPNAGPSAARNAGVGVAVGELILFTDDDCVADPGLLNAHRLAHQHSGSHGRVVIGPMPSNDHSTLSPWTKWEQQRIERTCHDLAVGTTEPTWRNLYTSNASILRADLIDIGGFDTTLRRAEDIELGQRLDQAGFEFVFEPDALIDHRPIRTLEAWQLGAERYGRAATILQARDGHPIGSIQSSEEFVNRHGLVRAVATLTANHPYRLRSTLKILRGMFRWSSALRLNGLAEMALSLIFNTIFFGAMAREVETWSEKAS